MHKLTIVKPKQTTWFGHITRSLLKPSCKVQRKKEESEEEKRCEGKTKSKNGQVSTSQPHKGQESMDRPRKVSSGTPATLPGPVGKVGVICSFLLYLAMVYEDRNLFCNGTGTHVERGESGDRRRHGGAQWRKKGGQQGCSQECSRESSSAERCC